MKDKYDNLAKAWFPFYIISTWSDRSRIGCSDGSARSQTATRN